jgi:phosphate uptake regulator
MTNERLARHMVNEDSVIDALYAQIVRKVVATADRSSDAMAAHLDLLSVAKNLEPRCGPRSCWRKRSSPDNRRIHAAGE